MGSMKTIQTQKHKMTVEELLNDTSSNDPLWLDIKRGLDAALQGKMRVWKPRYIKVK